jgi:hypothetical protein
MFLIKGKVLGFVSFSHWVLKMEVLTAWAENIHNKLKYLLACNEHRRKTWFSKSGVHKFRADKFCMMAPNI